MNFREAREALSCLIQRSVIMALDEDAHDCRIERGAIDEAIANRLVNCPDVIKHRGRDGIGIGPVMPKLHRHRIHIGRRRTFLRELDTRGSIQHDGGLFMMPANTFRYSRKGPRDRDARSGGDPVWMSICTPVNEVWMNVFNRSLSAQARRLT